MNAVDVIKSFIWKLCERGASQIVSVIVQICLARLLSPEDFGALAIMIVFTNIANVFIQKGFASSLIRKKDASSLDYNTAFAVSELIALFCVLVLFFSAPYIARFYNNDMISSYLRVLSISLLFGALYSVENAILVREMRFKLIFKLSLLAAVVSGGLGIIAAYLNYGVWALVLQIVSQQVILCITTGLGCGWRPHLAISKKSFNELFSFGSRILVAEIISMVVEDLRTLIIGKRYSSVSLAYYDRGQYYPAAIMRGIYDTISSVMLPVLSKEQDNENRLGKSITMSINISTYLTFPIFVGLAAVAENFVILLLTDQWAGSIPFLKLFCIYQLAFPVYGIMRQSLYAIGNSSSVLKLEVIKGVLFISAILFGCMRNPLFVALLTCLALYITTLLYVICVRQYVHFSIKPVIKCVGKTIVQCALMYSAISACNLFLTNRILGLIIDILLGVFLYTTSSFLFKNEAFRYCFSFICKR